MDYTAQDQLQRLKDLGIQPGEVFVDPTVVEALEDLEESQGVKRFDEALIVEIATVDEVPQVVEDRAADSTAN